MNVNEVGDNFNCDCGFSWRRGQSGSHSCGDGLRKQIANLKAQRDALAAENAALNQVFSTKEFPTEVTDAFSDTVVLRIDGDEHHSWQWIDNDSAVICAVLNAMKPETPATDAYLNSVRAEAVESFAHQQRVIADAEPDAAFQRHRRFAAGLAEDFAAQLLAGKDGE